MLKHQICRDAPCRSHPLLAYLIHLGPGTSKETNSEAWLER